MVFTLVPLGFVTIYSVYGIKMEYRWLVYCIILPATEDTAKSSLIHRLPLTTLREESSQTNVIVQYKLLAAILSAVCSVIQQS